MNNIKDNQLIINGKQSFARRVITWVTLFFFLSQSVTPALASVMSDRNIESQLSINNEFVRDLTNAYYQYIGSPYINASAPSGELTSIEELLDVVIDDYDFAVGGTTYVPILIAGITTFIPTYPQYKAVGDPLVQSRYIRAQIRAMLGRTIIDSSKTIYASEGQQLETLFQNGINYIQSDPSKRIGDRLNFDQDNAPLAAPMIWPELRTIHGEEVLVPIVYLTSTELARRVTGNTVEINEGALLGDLIIEGTTIKFGREAFLNVVNNLLNNQGYITSDGNLTIRVGGELRNVSGLIQAQGNLAIAAKSIYSGTIVHQYETHNGTDGYFGEIAEINSETGDVVLRAVEDIIIAGSLVTAGNDIRFAANGNIYVGTVQLNTSYSEEQDKGWRESRGSSIEYLGSALSAEDSIQLIADGQILIDASEIVADNGHIELLAGLGITVQDRLNTTQTYKKGKFGKTKKEVSTYKTVAMRSLLDAGRDLTLHAEFGDITLKSVDISTTQGTSVTASNGAINLLVTKETDHYSYSSVRKSLFTIKTVNRGHDIETVVPTTIIGGFQANPLYGLNVEYEGNPDYTFDQQVSALAGMPGLEWMAEVRARDDVNWTAVESKYEEWNESNTSLSPAAIAIITIVVAVVTGGSGTGLAGAISSGAGNAATTALASAGVSTAASAAAGAAIGAGVSAAAISLITASVIAASNALVNGDNPLDAIFETITSSDALRSAAIAAVTAGAIQALDAEFFNATQIGAKNATSGLVNASNIINPTTGQLLTDAAGNVLQSFSLSFTGQILQAATHAAVSATVETVIAGGEIEDLFITAFALNSVHIIGENLAGAIGVASKPDIHGNPPQINQITRYIAHAAVGCLTGTLTSEINDGDTGSSCAAGAGGAVVGELIADAYIESNQELLNEVDTFLNNEENYFEYLQSDEIGLTADQAFDLLNSQRSYHLGRLNDLSSRGVDLARLGAGLTAFIAGADASQINIAAQSGANAAEHNAFFIPAAIWLVSVIGYALLLKEVNGLSREILDAGYAGDEKLQKEKVVELAKVLSIELALTLTGTKAADLALELYNKAKLAGKGADELKALEDLGRQLDQIDNPGGSSRYDDVPGQLFSQRPTSFDPIEPALLERIKLSFARQGKVIDTSDDALRFLELRQADGVTFNSELILLRPDASPSTVFEELIHATQHRTGLYAEWAKQYGNAAAVSKAEYEAAKRLVKNQRAYGISDGEHVVNIGRVEEFANQLLNFGVPLE